MGTVRIVTDSLSWLPPEVAEEHCIEVVPLHVFFGQERYTETVNITNEEFYARLRTGDVLPKTSQPSPGEFQQVFEALANDADTDGIVCITASAKISGTNNSARAAAQAMAGKRIEVIDTELAALAEGSLVIEAARAAAAGADTDAVVARVRELQPHCGVALTLDTLDYLYKGGRIGRAQHLVGGLLRFRPVLHMDGGELAPLARPRTRRKAVARLLQYTAERAGGNELAMAGILHGDAPDAAAELRRQVEARFKVGEVYESQIGPVIGTYTGPDALGLCFRTP
jgi:DegV family protein with EDD domain